MVIWDGEVFILIYVDYDAHWNSGGSHEHSHHILNNFLVILIYLYLILSYDFSSVLPWNE